MGDYTKLLVWREAKDLAVAIYRLTRTKHFAADTGLRDQIQRAAVSIPSNIAEGEESGTNKQSIRYFYHARASAAELHTQLIIAQEIEYISLKELDNCASRCKKIGAMLNKLISVRISKNE